MEKTDRVIPESETFSDLMGIEFLPASAGSAAARLKVDRKLCQPFGFLSGGASLALAETLAGHGSLAICARGEFPFGVQVSGNHLLPVPEGTWITACGTILMRGRGLHVWNIELFDEQGRLVSTSRVVNYIKRGGTHHGAEGMEADSRIRVQ